MSGTVTEAMLHAYADDRLPAEAHAEVEAFLAAHPHRAAEVEAWRRQNEALAHLFPDPGTPVPARLDIHALAGRNRTPLWQWAAAALIVFALGGALGWLGRGLAPSVPAYDRLITAAIDAHALYVREKRHAVEVAASEKDHLVTWLSNRIERPLGAPDLTAQGFALVGGRLLPTDSEAGAGPAAQLMYENATSERVTVYVTAAIPDSPAYELADRNGFSAFYWADSQITCTVVGDLPQAEMDGVAKSIYRQMTRRPDEYRGL